MKLSDLDELDPMQVAICKDEDGKHFVVAATNQLGGVCDCCYEVSRYSVEVLDVITIPEEEL